MGRNTSQVTAEAVTTTTPARLIKLFEKKTTGESHSRNVLISPGTPLRHNNTAGTAFHRMIAKEVYIARHVCSCDKYHNTLESGTPEIGHVISITSPEETMP
jgi:hypothetical protein